MIDFRKIPIIIVNLEDRKDRRAWVQGHLAEQDIFSYAVFKATEDKDGVKGLLYTMTSIMKGLYDAEYPYVLILEDDFEFIVKTPIRKIISAVKALPEDFDMLYLGCNLEKPDSTAHSKHLIKIKSAKAAHSIIFSKKAIEKAMNLLIELSSPIPYDELLIEIQKEGNSYATKTLITGQHEGYSDIQKKVVSYNNMLKNRFEKNTKHIK